MFLGDDAAVGAAFDVDLIASDAMRNAIDEWDAISTGEPYWLNPEDDIEDSVNLAKLIADKRASLTVLDIGISIDGSKRAERLQELADSLLEKLPEKVAEADRLGGIMIKFNGEGWDFFKPGDFGITGLDGNGRITGAVFASYLSKSAKEHYTRLEYHRFEGKKYLVSNKAFKTDQSPLGMRRSLGRQVPLDTIEEWAEIEPEVSMDNLEKPLFAYFRIPGANNVDPDSPYGLAVFANAIPELKAVDVAAARMRGEIEDSKHMTFVGQTITKNAENKGIQLPRFVVGLGMGLNDSETSAIHEHAPTLLTAARIQDINFNLSLAGVKCGFSPGMFVLDGQSGVITATQVEANDRDTVQTIKGDRDALKAAVDVALKGADAFLSLYEGEGGEFEISYNWGDITYNYEEDRAAWQGYVMRGWAPVWMYFNKFEGMSEEEAKKLVAEAQAAQMQTMQMFGAVNGGGGNDESAV